MNSLWNDKQAAGFADDPLQLRVYSSRLLGQEPSLVLHGGGNTSVKADVKDLFGDSESVLFVKGSGWDLATIEAAGFAPVRLDVLRRMAELPQLSDADMVKAQRAAMTDPAAPNPSVEAILHAIIPFKYVDHTHADAVVTLTNTPDGQRLVRDLYGPRMLIVPYVMPGFVLAKAVYDITRNVDWRTIDGMILMHHGVFTFADDAKTSYERMIEFASKAEQYIKQHTTPRHATASAKSTLDLIALARLRRAVSLARGAAMIALTDTSPEAAAFAGRSDVKNIATRGPLTPDHVIRTKRTPLIVGDDVDAAVAEYAGAYRAYFDRHTDGNLTCLDPAPRWAIVRGSGGLSAGPSGGVCFERCVKEAAIVRDIAQHTMAAIDVAEQLGGWKPLPEKDIFDVEYWELEQAKLAKAGAALPLQGKVALVTGAASGIGRGCAEALQAQGAAVAALDLRDDITEIFSHAGALGLVCDVTDRHAVAGAVAMAVSQFGGLDILVTNAGTFPASAAIADMDAGTWQRSIAVNLTSHQIVLQACIPYLALGMDAAVVVIASRNVPAPGPGASAYSVAKAGLTQLARVAALELAESGVRVNILHPDAVFDTGIWTDEVLAKRAAHYGLSVQQYKTKNLLKVEITSKDVAALACAMAGPLFAKTTGSQVPIDGGNDRVI